MSQFDLGQRNEALALIERMAWGSMDDDIRDLETALRLALEATADDFRRWEDEVVPALESEGYSDELNLPARRIADFTLAEKRCYVAGLLRTLAISYGVSAEYGGARTGLVGEECEGSPAALLRGLNDISWLPTSEER